MKNVDRKNAYGYCIVHKELPKENREIYTLEELTKVFDISGISKSPSVFDYDKLEWFNSEYIKNMSEDEFIEVSIPYFKEALGDMDIDYHKLASILQQRTTKLIEIPEKIEKMYEIAEHFGLNITGGMDEAILSTGYSFWKIQ